MAEIQRFSDPDALCGVCLERIGNERWEMMGSRTTHGVIVTHYRCFPGNQKQYLKTRRNPNPLPIPWAPDIVVEARRRGIKGFEP